ncbi:hypothetical protein GXW83_24550 [Streptacidiphilus sp. PB12-B1b]|uniref:DUF6000 family protein n=1 Tax=Streptacidiphilus sp. PB12-B1b TaxID=2705012 RepID=UPI0015FCE5EE|nr:DUF6000 family protein [Streptacidiphilus sp. PB12-B1b]QMU78402.1 hypothetical protein GXW83_24550 [Streptacidiphilus sp. PB12-B1b]
MAARSRREDRSVKPALWGTPGDPSGMRRLRLVGRWVTPGRRYFRLLGGAFVMSRPRQRWLQWRLQRAGRRAPAEDLVFLLDNGGWREWLAVTWLIAAGRRADLRDRLEHGLMGETPCGYRWDYCTALARPGTERDAEILRAYLDRALSLPPDPDTDDPSQCQAQAMGALLYLDQELGTSHSRHLLAPDGPWQRWRGSLNAPLDELRQALRDDVTVAAGGNPGLRRRLRRRRGKPTAN